MVMSMCRGSVSRVNAQVKTNQVMVLRLLRWVMFQRLEIVHERLGLLVPEGAAEPGTPVAVQHDEQLGQRASAWPRYGCLRQPTAQAKQRLGRISRVPRPYKPERLMARVISLDRRWHTSRS